MIDLENLTLEEIYIISRYKYKVGDPIISDSDYDMVDREMKANYPHMSEYYERTYDDDPVPYDLLKKCGDSAYIEKSSIFSLDKETQDIYNSLNEDKSLSIDSAISYEEAFPFFQFLKENKLDFMTSLKMDGNNTKTLFVKNNLKISMSRGRGSGNSFDFTYAIKKVLPNIINFNQDNVMVYSESYVTPEALPYLREKYNKERYVTAKSAAISMLRVPHASDDYKYLKTSVFYAEGLSDTLDGMFAKLEKMDIQTPPHRLFSWSDIPDNFTDFKIWLKREIFDYIWNLSQGVPSDGVVIEVNDLLWEGIQKNQYSNRQKALKFDHWDFKTETGIVEDILIEQQRVFMSVIVKIKPIQTYDGCTATRINVFNPSILINSGICKGSTVEFERNSGAVNILKR